MLARLAFRNVKRQIGYYLIYFITVVLSAALLFAVNTLMASEPFERFARTNEDMRLLIRMITAFVSLVTSFVLSYATSFMLRLRKKEFGMYLTLGMTRKDIQGLFAGETLILSGIALAAGIGVGLLISRLFMVLFCFLLDIPGEMFTYSLKATVLTIAIGALIFLFAFFFSMRYLKKAEIKELMSETYEEQGAKRPVFWCVLSLVLFAVILLCAVKTYDSLIESFGIQSSMMLFVWMGLLLVLIFLFHLALARGLFGTLMQKKQTAWTGTNTVILRGLSGRMTTNSVLIGVFAILLTFSIIASNIAFGEKVYSEESVEIACPYDVRVELAVSEAGTPGMEKIKQIIEDYNPISSQIDFALLTTGKTEYVSRIDGYESIAVQDKYMPLGQFNALLSGCGYEPVSLNGEYMIVTNTMEIVDTDFHDVTLTLNGEPYAYARTKKNYPEFVPDYVYAVVPDEAVAGMEIYNACVSCQLANSDFDVQAMSQALSHALWDTDEENDSDYFIKQEYRDWVNSNSGALIIGMIYLSAVFVCMALAILAMKTLSSLSEERRRFEVLYRLGVDSAMQKQTLFRQTAAFFFLPSCLPVLSCTAMGVACGKVYALWGFPETSYLAWIIAAVIGAVMLGIYALYFAVTYRAVCWYVVCEGGWDD